MEDGKDKFCNPTPYYCHTCRIYCASAINLQTHFLGLKHQAVEEALKAHGLVKALNASAESVSLPESLPDFIYTEPEKYLGSTLEEQLETCKDSEPAIGLQYIVEYRSKDMLMYECNLCLCQSGLTNMFMHVLGNKHRLAYLKKHRPELGEVRGRGSKLNIRVKELAEKVEREDGRHPIRSTMDMPVPKDDIYSVHRSDSFVTWFTEDDPRKGQKNEDPKPTAKEEDKKAEEVSKTKADNSNKSEVKKEPEQGTVPPESTLFIDSDSDSEEFTSNEGLLKYLKRFEIVNEDDAAFILKVTQKLTDALIWYREKASERKNVPEQNQCGNSGDHSEQRTPVGAPGPCPDDFSQWSLPAEHSFEGTGTDSCVKIPAKRKVSQLHADVLKERAKAHKRGSFVPSFKEVPDEPDSCDPEGPAEPRGPRAPSRDARYVEASRDPDAAFRDCRRREAVRRRGAISSIFKRQGVLSSLRKQPRVPPPVPSQSESKIIRGFLSSARNMDEDKAAGTLQKMTEPNPAFSAPVGPRKTVWIIGHDIIYSAEAYTNDSGWGPALGLEDRLQIQWIGRKGMLWNDLLPAVSLQLPRLGSPDALVIQLGENDLPGQKEVDFNITIAADLHTLISRLPETRFFWSDMMERREWPGSTSPDQVDLVRRKITDAAGRIIEAAGGVVIQHPEITFKYSALFRSDGINLSEWGLDFWLHSVRHELLCWLQSS